jgi:hypothetical protein
MEVVTKGVMYRTRKRWKEIMSERLVIVKETVIRDDHSGKVIRELEEAGLISRHYDTSCLAVDVWYIFDRRPVYAHKRFEQINSVRDPFNRLFFGITIQAIYDVKCHRPCDANSWIIDIPPGNDRCSPSVHICEAHAKKFIYETADYLESVLDLPAGTIVEIVDRKNGSLRSHSSEILNCNDQES